MPKPWERYFSNLGSWICTSPATRSYNCIAWAAGDNTQRWWPDPFGSYYWPITTRSTKVEFFVQAYATLGYELCDDGSLEQEFEKIAIYAVPPVPTGNAKHAARQLEDGKWTSKLGDEQDITHETPESVNCVVYGSPVCFMKRRRQGT
jgi:hypothetical protein